MMMMTKAHKMNDVNFVNFGPFLLFVPPGLKMYIQQQKLSFVKAAVWKIGAFTCYYLCKCPTYSSQTPTKL